MLYSRPLARACSRASTAWSRSASPCATAPSRRSLVDVVAGHRHARQVRGGRDQVGVLEADGDRRAHLVVAFVHHLLAVHLVGRGREQPFDHHVLEDLRLDVVFPHQREAFGHGHHGAAQHGVVGQLDRRGRLRLRAGAEDPLAHGLEQRQAALDARRPARRARCPAGPTRQGRAGPARAPRPAPARSPRARPRARESCATPCVPITMWMAPFGSESRRPPAPSATSSTAASSTSIVTTTSRPAQTSASDAATVRARGAEGRRLRPPPRRRRAGRGRRRGCGAPCRCPCGRGRRSRLS